MSYKKKHKKKRDLPEIISIPVIEVLPTSKQSDFIECPKCYGDGQKLWMHGGWDICGHCNGTGKLEIKQE